MEIRYFTSGITWSADYVAEAARNEKTMGLAGHVRITNNSGEDYENAEVRLVVGVIRLVEDIANLARAGRPMPTTVAFNEESRSIGGARARMEMAKCTDAAAAAPRQIIKEGVSEYFLYTVEGRDTIPTGWSKRLPSIRAADVPIVSYYKFEREQWGEQVVRFYRFKNDKPSKLGDEPLPDGLVNAFRFVTDDRLYSYVGRTNVKYIPIGEQIEMNLGNDQEVRVEPKLLNWEKLDIRFDQWGGVVGWTIRETWQIEVQNSKDIAIVADIRRNFAGDWSLEATGQYEKVDAGKVKFIRPLNPREQQQVEYVVTTRYGVNATR